LVFIGTPVKIIASLDRCFSSSVMTKCEHIQADVGHLKEYGLSLVQNKYFYRALNTGHSAKWQKTVVLKGGDIASLASGECE
jgi:hypothetical protein